MERIETINLKTETDALEAGHDITLYTFDEYGRLMHYAHIVASTPKEREDATPTTSSPSSKAGTICADSTGRWKRLSELRINHRIHQDHLVQHAHLVGT